MKMRPSSFNMLNLAGLLMGLLAWASPALAADKPANKIKIVCVGDSITEAGYPQMLGTMLGGDYEVKNLGVSGATLMKKGDFSYWSLKKIEEAETFGPQIVTILLGANDTKPQNWKNKDTFLADYVALITALKNLSSRPIVYVLIPAPVFGNGNYGIDGAILRNEATPLIVKAAQDTRTETMDLYTPLAGSHNMFPDNVHPNNDASGKIAKLICEALVSKKCVSANVLPGTDKNAKQERSRP